MGDAEIIVREAALGDQERWDNFVLGHPGGTAYHRFAWGQAVREAYGHEPLYLLAEASREILGVLPLIVFRRPLLGGSLVSLPFCDVGGMLVSGAEVESALLQGAMQRAERLKIGLELRVCRSGTASEHLHGSGKVLMWLALPGSAEALLAGFHAKLRSQVKKPLRDGLTARLGGAELVDAFYGVFSRNMRELGSPVHSRQWIRRVVSSYGEAVRVGVVFTPSGEPAAGGVILLHGKKVSVPWASSLRRLNHLNPNMLLYWTFLAFAADHGFERFDFGRSTPGEGTFRFKQQWGAEPVLLEWTQWIPRGKGTPVAEVAAKGRGRALAEAVWNRFPLALCNLIGPRVRRYVSL